MKATIGGLRHLVRKLDLNEHQAHEILRTALEQHLPAAHNGEPSKALPALGDAIVAVTYLADQKYDRSVQDILWSLRLDEPPSSDDAVALWKKLEAKIIAEQLDGPLSFIRMINALSHLASVQQSTLREAAYDALQRMGHP